MKDAWRNTHAIAMKELSGYFSSSVAYIFLIGFLLLTGFFTFLQNRFFVADEASLRVFFMWHPWLYTLFIPAIGMRLWAEERRSGTLELLLTLPLSLWQSIVGKFVAGSLFIALALLGTLPMVGTVCTLGSPDLRVMACGYLGSFLMAVTFLALSGFFSAATRNQVVSFVLSLLLSLFLVMAGWEAISGWFVTWAPEWLYTLVTSASVMPRFDQLRSGVIDLRDVVYFLSIIGFGLSATWVVLRNHRSC